MADPIKLPPGATLVSNAPMKLPPGATLVGAPASAPSADSRNGIQKAVDAAAAPDSPEVRAGRGVIGNAFNDFGRGATEMLLSPAVHPLNTLAGLGHSIAHPIDTIGNMVKAPIQDFQQNGATEAIPHLLGQVAGGVAGGELTKAATPILGEGMARTGQGMQSAGVDVINRTVGALKKDFERGTNPGRGYFDAGLGPSISMGSIADKAAAAKSAVGAQIGTAIDAPIANIAKIPAQAVAGRLQGPLGKAFDLENGPGGMGNTAPLEEYASSFRPAVQGAAAQGGFTPRGLFDLKKGIAANTNWSDPAQFNLKAVRQQQAGALGGLLEENVPGLEPLNQNYADLLKLTKRAQTRAETGSSPLTSLAGKLGGGALGAAMGAGHGVPGITLGTALGFAADSVPVKTTLGSGLYYGGKGLSAVGTKIKRIGN